MSEREKMDFFDYDSYVKKKRKKKPAAKKNKPARFKKPARGKSPAAEARGAPAIELAVDLTVGLPVEPMPELSPELPNKSALELPAKPAVESPLRSADETQSRTAVEGGERRQGRHLKHDSYDSIESIKKMFDDALNEGDDEIAELTSEETEPAPPPEEAEGLRRKLLYALGLTVILLAGVGLFSTVGFLDGLFKAFADNTKEKNEFARFIYPIVICDPAPFDQTVKLRGETMLTAAIWDIILYADHSKYNAEFDYIIVPEVDVERHAIGLFGQGLSFEHTSILGTDVEFFYEEDIKSYYIPSKPRFFTYSPYIENIVRVGERYTLTVGYVSPTPAWLTLPEGEAPTPEKYVDYIVSKRGNEYTLIAIQESALVVDPSIHGL